MAQPEILSQIRDRWSPRVFKDIKIDNQYIESLIEAARWAPSFRNGQPWRFVFASKDENEIWDKLFDCLTDGNKKWAVGASHLMLVCSLKNDPVSGAIRKYSWYDLGLSIGNLTFQANYLGIFVRNMAGFSPEKAIQNFSIPDSIEPVVMLALGYPDESVNFHPDYDVTFRNNRKRLDFSQIVYLGSWEKLLG